MAALFPIGFGYRDAIFWGSFGSVASDGVLSKVVFRALSKSAKIAGCWMNTGEGGLSAYHLEGDCDIVHQIETVKLCDS
ncbi:hypothetical protein BA953_24900 (plasmid) [Vibrio coralliilyticus]|nr:hypothetical protein BA953_24900 [Vibrio coralliilyticus]